jgi:hypothetical protein
MGIMDKLQEGLNKGKELVNKTMGGQQSAQATASPQDVQTAAPPDAQAQATDATAPTTDAGTQTPTDPTTEV